MRLSYMKEVGNFRNHATFWPVLTLKKKSCVVWTRETFKNSEKVCHFNVHDFHKTMQNASVEQRQSKKTKTVASFLKKKYENSVT